MNREEVLADFARRDINPRVFSFDVEQDDRICLTNEPSGDWLVFYSERGKRYHLKVFVTEGHANKYFHDIIVNNETSTNAFRERHRGPGY